MSDTSRIAVIVTTIGGMIGIFYTMLSMGVFEGFEVRIGNSNVAQMVFMSLIVMLAMAITFETVFVMKRPKDLLSNLQSGLAQYTGSSEAEVNKFFGDMATKVKGTAASAVSKLGLPDVFKSAASSLVEQVPTKVTVNQVATGNAKKRKKGRRDVFEVEATQTKYPTPAELLAKLRATFASLPLEPAQVAEVDRARVNQVRRSILEVAADDVEVLPAEPASASDSVPVTEYTKKRNRRTLYFIIAVGAGCLACYLLSLYF